jgi:hypothetical protein
MLATIRNRISYRIATLALPVTLALSLSSCATNKDTALISDPNEKKENALPWNQQQQWEREGEGGAINQQTRR